MKKLLKYGLLSLSLVTLVGFLEVSSLSRFGTVTVFASEITDQTQATIDTIRTKRDEVLQRLRQLSGGEEVESIFDRRFFELKDLDHDPNIVDQKDNLLRRLDTELFRIELIAEVYAEMQGYYAKIQQANPWTALDLYQGKEIFERSNSMTDRRYMFSEASLTTIPGNSYEVYRLANDSNENTLIAARDELVGFFKEAAETSDLMLEFKNRYNDLVRYFNAQPEAVRKGQYQEFAKDRLSSLYYEVTKKIFPHNVEQIREELKRLEYRVKGQVVSQSKREQIAQLLVSKKAMVVEELKKLPYIDLTNTRLDLLDVTAYGYTDNKSKIPGIQLDKDATSDEAQQFQDRRLKEWDQLLSKLRLMDRFLSRINKVEKSYGKKGDNKHVIYVYDSSIAHAAEPARINEESKAKSPAIAVGRGSGAEFVADKLTIKTESNSQLLYNVNNIVRNDMSDEAAFSQLIRSTEEKVSLYEKRYEAQSELVGIYNQMIEKINTLPKEVRRERWLKFIYQENPSLYLLDAIRLTTVESLEQLEMAKEDLIKRMRIFETNYLGGVVVVPSVPTVGANTNQRLPLRSISGRPTASSSPSGTVLGNIGNGLVGRSSFSSGSLKQPSTIQSETSRGAELEGAHKARSSENSNQALSNNSASTNSTVVAETARSEHKVLPKTGEKSLYLALFVGLTLLFFGFGLVLYRQKH